MSRKRLLASGLIAFGITIGGALGFDPSGDDKPVVASVATTGMPATAAPTTTAALPVYPLTGLPVADETRRNRAAVVIKVEDAPEARPQFGMDKADVVLEEKVEGGLSRFMTIYQSQDAGPVGPIRSLRSTDVYALRPLGGALMGYSGGIQPFKNLLPSSGLVDVSADSRASAYKRMAGREYVHSLYSSTNQLRAVAPSTPGAPRRLFTFLNVGEVFAPTGVVNTRSVDGDMAAGNHFDWTWDAASATWKRGNNGKASMLTTGQISATNVIIQFVPYRPTPYRDRANTVVDEAILDGTGDSFVLSQGKIVAGRWIRPDLSQPTQYNDGAGNPVKLTPGTTWVVLIPAGNSVRINP